MDYVNSNKKNLCEEQGTPQQLFFLNKNEVKSSTGVQLTDAASLITCPDTTCMFGYMYYVCVFYLELVKLQLYSEVI